MIWEEMRKQRDAGRGVNSELLLLECLWNGDVEEEDAGRVLIMRYDAGVVGWRCRGK